VDSSRKIVLLLYGVAAKITAASSRGLMVLCYAANFLQIFQGDQGFGCLTGYVQAQLKRFF